MRFPTVTSTCFAFGKSSWLLLGPTGINMSENQTEPQKTVQILHLRLGKLKLVLLRLDKITCAYYAKSCRFCFKGIAHFFSHKEQRERCMEVKTNVMMINDIKPSIIHCCPVEASARPERPVHLEIYTSFRKPHAFCCNKFSFGYFWPSTERCMSSAR